MLPGHIDRQPAQYPQISLIRIRRIFGGFQAEGYPSEQRGGEKSREAPSSNRTLPDMAVAVPVRSARVHRVVGVNEYEGGPADGVEELSRRRGNTFGRPKIMSGSKDVCGVQAHSCGDAFAPQQREEVRDLGESRADLRACPGHRLQEDSRSHVGASVSRGDGTGGPPDSGTAAGSSVAPRV